MVGFNRRFAPLAVEAKRHLSEGPMSVIYRVNAGAIAPDSWIQDPEIGGGRIVGEACHFIDFLTFLCGSVPTSVHAVALPDAEGLNDTVTINLQFANGSIGTIHYFANGAKSLEKEYVEVYQTGQTAVLRDFRELVIHGGRKPFRKKLLTQDKGQSAMVRAFVDRVRDGGRPLIPFDELTSVTRATFAALESIKVRQAVAV